MLRVAPRRSGIMPSSCVDQMASDNAGTKSKGLSSYLFSGWQKSNKHSIIPVNNGPDEKGNYFISDKQKQQLASYSKNALSGPMPNGTMDSKHQHSGSGHGRKKTRKHGTSNAHPLVQSANTTTVKVMNTADRAQRSSLGLYSDRVGSNRTSGDTVSAGSCTPPDTGRSRASIGSGSSSTRSPPVLSSSSNSSTSSRSKLARDSAVAERKSRLMGAGSASIHSSGSNPKKYLGSAALTERSSSVSSSSYYESPQPPSTINSSNASSNSSSSSSSSRNARSLLPATPPTNCAGKDSVVSAGSAKAEAEVRARLGRKGDSRSSIGRVSSAINNTTDLSGVGTIKDAAPSSSGSSSKPLCCDKCDGKHETTDCPYYKKSRDKHPDAQRSGKQMGGTSTLPGSMLRNARVVRQPGDGSCLFHSMSYGLPTRSNASTLRSEICSFIASNPKFMISETPLKDWVKWDSGSSVSQYSRTMSRGSWGGGIEMACCSQLKGVNVHVYERVGSGFKRISAFDHPSSPETKAVVRVLYCGGVHYDALVV